MRFVFLVLGLLPATALANPNFKSDQLDWAFLGSAVVNGQVTALNCVKGDESFSEFERPQVVYRLRSIKEEYDDGKSSQLIAEIVITDSKKTIANVVSNSRFYLSKQSCGEDFLSTLFYGARFAYTLTLDTMEAEQISNIELVEAGDSRATEFFTKVKAATASLKTIRGAGVEMVGSLEIPTSPMDETFNAYKSKALSDKSLRRLVGAESSKYPRSIFKDFKQ